MNHDIYWAQLIQRCKEDELRRHAHAENERALRTWSSDRQLVYLTKMCEEEELRRRVRAENVRALATGQHATTTQVIKQLTDTQTLLNSQLEKLREQLRSVQAELDRALCVHKEDSEIISILRSQVETLERLVCELGVPL